MNAVFDTLKLARRLRDEAGFSPAHAEAAADAFADAVGGQDLVTKADIREMATKADISQVRSEVAALRSEFKAEIRDMATKADLAEAKADLFKWMVGIALGQAAVIATLVKLL